MNRGGLIGGGLVISVLEGKRGGGRGGRQGQNGVGFVLRPVRAARGWKLHHLTCVGPLQEALGGGASAWEAKREV